MFIKMWLHFMLDKKNWCTGKDFALQYENERFKFVATLALGLRPRQRGCKVAGQEEARESHHILLGV